ATPAVSTHDDAHRESEPIDWDSLDGGLHVLTMPTRVTPGYGSPLSKAQGLGPLLVLGARSRQDLNGLGLIRRAPLDGQPGTGWFVTEERVRAVRVFTAEEVRSLLHKRSARGATAGRRSPARTIIRDRSTTTISLDQTIAAISRRQRQARSAYRTVRVRLPCPTRAGGRRAPRSPASRA